MFQVQDTKQQSSLPHATPLCRSVQGRETALVPMLAKGLHMSITFLQPGESTQKSAARNALLYNMIIQFIVFLTGHSVISVLRTENAITVKLHTFYNNSSSAVVLSQIYEIAKVNIMRLPDQQVGDRQNSLQTPVVLSDRAFMWPLRDVGLVGPFMYTSNCPSFKVGAPCVGRCANSINSPEFHTISDVFRKEKTVSSTDSFSL